MSNKLTLKAKNPKLIAEWLSKFPNVSNDMIIEVNLDSNELNTKAYSLHKDTVKVGGISFNELGIEVCKKSNESRVDVGIIDISKFIKKLMLCKDTESKLNIEYNTSNIEGYFYGMKDRVEVSFASDINIASAEGKLNTRCGTPSIFKKMHDDTVKGVINIDNGVKFCITPQQIDKIKSFSSLDSKQDKGITFCVEEHVLKVKNKNFEYILLEGIDNSDLECVIDLTLLNRIDDESYECCFDDSKIVLSSIDTNTFITICALSVA